jgi:hypothetical protein
MVVAQFAVTLRSFKAEQFHLAVTDNPIVRMDEIWDFREATTAVEKKNRSRA